jgi:glycosyltransferase involved in cell wall biosynthesis
LTARRVLHLINGEYFGGSARVLMNYLQVPTRTSDVAVGVFFHGDLERRLEAAGIPTEFIRMRSRFDLTAARQVSRLARRFNADIIHTHQVRNALVGRLAARPDRRPVVSHVHSPAFRESGGRLRNVSTGSIDRLLAGWTHRFITVSNSLAAEMAALGVPRERIRVVPNGIPLPANPATSARADLRGEFGLDDNAQLIGLVANLRPRKGADILIQALGLLHDPFGRVRLMLVGEPFREGGRDYGRELREVAASMGVGERTFLVGFRPDVEEILAGLDLFVLPSLFGEGLPMVLLEAMGAALPVISTPVEGIPEVIANEQNGLLVPTEDPASLARAIERLLADPALRQRLGEAGRRTVLERYTADGMAAAIERVYDELIAS